MTETNDGFLTPAQARDLAIWLHGDQTDFGGQPYPIHLDAVVANLGPNATDAEKVEGVLHDSLEDVTFLEADGSRTRLTPEELEAYGVWWDNVLVIMLLTRDPVKEDAIRPLPGETSRERSQRVYLLKIQSIIDSDAPAAVRLRAIRVKIADNKHNQDPARDRFLSPDQLPKATALKQRYALSRTMLEAAEADLLKSMGIAGTAQLAVAQEQRI
jgi:hypothetical protein